MYNRCMDEENKDKNYAAARLRYAMNYHDAALELWENPEFYYDFHLVANLAEQK